MRPVTLLFLTVLLLQTMWPCQDRAISLLVDTAVSQKPNEGRNEAKTDACSPFCQCACCATPTVVNFLELPAPPLETSPYVPVHGHPCKPTLNISLTVWQPPKLVG